MTLKEFRKSQGLTQAQAGEAMGVTKQRFGQIEKAWPNVDHTTMDSIALNLGAVLIVTSKGWKIITHDDLDAPGDIYEEE